MSWAWQNRDQIGHLLLSHLYLALVPVVFGIVVAIPVGIMCVRWRWTWPPILSLTSIFYALPSLALYLVSPVNALMPEPEAPDLRGIFIHKNVLGPVMAAGALGSLYGIRTGRKRLSSLLMLGVFAAVAFASHSMTSVAASQHSSACSGRPASTSASTVRRVKPSP